jgi:hypothetical protein
LAVFHYFGSVAAGRPTRVAETVSSRAQVSSVPGQAAAKGFRALISTTMSGLGAEYHAVADANCAGPQRPCDDGNFAIIPVNLQRGKTPNGRVTEFYDRRRLRVKRDLFQRASYMDVHFLTALLPALRHGAYFALAVTSSISSFAAIEILLTSLAFRSAALRSTILIRLLSNVRK